MAIGHAVQRGTLIYIYDVESRLITAISAPGRWPEDGLIGFSRKTIQVRKGSLIYTYDEYGHRVGQPSSVTQKNTEYMSNIKNYMSDKLLAQ